MVTTYRGSGNTFSTAVSGGVIPSDQIIRKIDSWSDKLEPDETPFLSALKKGKAVDQRKIEWGQSYRVQHTSEVEGALSNSAPLTVPTGHGTRFQKYDVLQIVNYVNNDVLTGRLDLDSREIVVVTELNPDDTINVARGSAGTTAIAHHDGAFVEKIGTAMTQNSDYALNPVRRGDMEYNYIQRFQASVRMDRSGRHTPTYETAGDQLLEDLEEQQLLLKQSLERTFWYGGRQAGNATTPEMCNGVDAYITTNRISLAGQKLNPQDLRDVQRDLWKSVGSMAAKEVWMDIDTYEIFQSFLNPQTQYSQSDTTIGREITTIKTPGGDIKLRFHRNVPPGKIYFLDMSQISYHPYSGMDWTTEKLSTDGPYDWYGVYGEFTLMLKKEATMAVLEDFDTDLDNYPLREYYA